MLGQKSFIGNKCPGFYINKYGINGCWTCITKIAQGKD